jgi:RimJ/RimL family protein N-acetyltransferase
MGMLYVDHDNEAARKLYFSLGFVDDHTDRAYVTDVAAGDESRPAGASDAAHGDEP